jgi:hypothetical protein
MKIVIHVRMVIVVICTHSKFINFLLHFNVIFIIINSRMRVAVPIGEIILT